MDEIFLPVFFIFLNLLFATMPIMSSSFSSITLPGLMSRKDFAVRELLRVSVSIKEVNFPVVLQERRKGLNRVLISLLFDISRIHTRFH